MGNSKGGVGLKTLASQGFWGARTPYHFKALQRFFVLALCALGVTFYIAIHVVYLTNSTALQQQQWTNNITGAEYYVTTAPETGFEHSGETWTTALTYNSTQPGKKYERRLPQCIIIGARKSGTRALLEFLNVHPAIERATDEVHFFDDDSKYALGLEWYRKHMPFSTIDQITIEKSPAYLVTPSVPERMWAMNNSLQLLLIVRDPVVRLISDYAQLAENKRLRRDSPRERRVPSFEEMVLLPDGSVNTEYRPVGTSMYAVYFRRWMALFPRRQIHVIDGDRLIRSPFTEVQQVETFLGLPHLIPQSAYSFNRTKGFYCVRGSDGIDRCLNETKGRKHPRVTPQVVSKLRQFYAPFNREFYQLVGRDFDWSSE